MKNLAVVTQRATPIALAALALGAAGCTSRAPALPPVVLHLADTPDKCIPMIDGKPVTLEALLAAARGWHGRDVIVGNGGATSYKCIGGIVFTLQRAGVKRVGFIAEPPKE